MQQISLAPVDGVHVTTLMDNSSDALLPDEGLVRRWGLAGTAAPLAVLPAELAEEKQSFDFLRAEHGFCPRARRWAIRRATAARQEWSALRTCPRKTQRVTSGEKIRSSQ